MWSEFKTDLYEFFQCQYADRLNGFSTTDKYTLTHPRVNIIGSIFIVYLLLPGDFYCWCGLCDFSAWIYYLCVFHPRGGIVVVGGHVGRLMGFCVYICVVRFMMFFFTHTPGFGEWSSVGSLGKGEIIGVDSVVISRLYLVNWGSIDGSFWMVGDTRDCTNFNTGCWYVKNYERIILMTHICYVKEWS